MNEIIIYGAGKSGHFAYLFLSSKYKIKAFADKRFDVLKKEDLFGLPVVSPHALLRMNYDKIFIASQERFEITKELVEIGIPGEKITGIPPDILLGYEEMSSEEIVHDIALTALAKRAVSPFYHYPILVNGASRSGTSVLVQGIGKHPLILGAKADSNYFRFFSNIITDIEFSEYGKTPRKTIKESPLQINGNIGKLMFECTFGANYGYKSWCNHSLWKDKHKLPYKAWSAKATLSEKILKEVQYVFPLVKCIVIFRNGINNVNSLRHWRKDNPSYNFEHWAKYWAEVISRLLPLQDKPGCLFVRHEELIEYPELFWGKIAEFLDLPLAKEMVNFSRENLVASTFPDPGLRGIPRNEIFKYRECPYKDWSTKEKDIFLRECSDGMKLLGYEIPF